MKKVIRDGKVAITKKSLNKGLEGITFLREMLEYLDNRIETLNENKTPIQLMNDYKTFLNKKPNP